MKCCIQCDNPMSGGSWRNTDCCCALCYIGWSRAKIKRLEDEIEETIGGSDAEEDE